MEASEVEKLAREAGLYVTGYNHAMYARFAALVEVAAMERAAKMCDDNAVDQQMMVITMLDDTPRSIYSRECAETIRAAIKAS